ncbi:MAG: pyruvate dehydrogenase (acetyl-transferring) E1 component subunit alpha [Chlamydiales bacterium]|nr:pyruvate dehydrogenase (acetyl-transferring) E1 component subunit alpha [Chlamydiales bacterium]
MTEYNFFKADSKKILASLSGESLLLALREMLLIRQFELRAESAYQQGLIGGFFHAYMGQEAIQTGCVHALGRENWFTTTYRCHALALLLGATPNEVMAELYGRATGNAQGRGGSMHLYADRLLGGFGIVGGHLPIATGAAFSLKYQDKKNAVSLCFLGDGATVQGAVHESLNLAALWDLPVIFVIENNQWGMGTAVSRAVAMQPIAENLAKSYGIESYTLDGMDFFNCYQAFKEMGEKIKQNSRPIIVEAITERFRGHSISDPGLYRSKEDLKKAMERDPIPRFYHALLDAKIIDEATFENMQKEIKQIVIDAMKFAHDSPWPDPITLEEGVYADH